MRNSARLLSAFSSALRIKKIGHQRGVEKEGLEKGLRKGLEQGREEGIRQSIELMVQVRFPALAELVKERVEHIQDREMLQQVLVAMSTAQTEKKARRYLLALETGQ